MGGICFLIRLSQGRRPLALFLAPSPANILSQSSSLIATEWVWVISNIPINQFGFCESFWLVHLSWTVLIKLFPVFCFQVMDYKHLGDLCLTQHEILSLPDLGDFLQETISIKIFPVQKQTPEMSFLWFWGTYESRLVTNLSWQRTHPAASGALIYLSRFISFLAVSFTFMCPQEAESQAGVLGIPCLPQQAPRGQQRLRNTSHQGSVADLGGSQHVTKSPSYFPWASKVFQAFWRTHVQFPRHLLALWIQTSWGPLKFPPVRCTSFVTTN